MQIPRFLQEKLLNSLKINPVIFVNGPRHSGKFTFAKQLLKAEYITLDDVSQMAAAAISPKEFLRGRSGPLIIDEIQLAPDPDFCQNLEEMQLQKNLVDL